MRILTGGVGTNLQENEDDHASIMCGVLGEIKTERSRDERKRSLKRFLSHVDATLMVSRAGENKFTLRTLIRYHSISFGERMLEEIRKRSH